MLGPLGGNDRWDALDQPHPVEARPRAPDFAAWYPGRLGGAIGWRNVSTGASFAAVLPLMPAAPRGAPRPMAPTNDSVAFAHAEHACAAAGAASLVFSTSGVGKVWLNGALRSAGARFRSMCILMC